MLKIRPAAARILNIKQQLHLNKRSLITANQKTGVIREKFHALSIFTQTGADLVK